MNIIKSLRNPRTRGAHQYMVPESEQKYITESYVSSPPAARITDEANNVFSLGYDYILPASGAPRGEFGFRVVLNGGATDEFASRIERRDGRVRIFTRSGWKHWTGRSFV